MDDKNYPPPAGGIPATYSQPAYPPNTTGIPATYSQPPPNYANQGVSATVTIQPTYVNTPGVGPGPSQVTCSSCRATIITQVEYEASTKTHLFALLLCLFGLWPCVCLPYCMDSCQSGRHYCPNCRAYLGTYNL
ncbi:lipopolysaccharide-induced tumor necrosis factor-alpha factor-like [Condylostylus longicornis]|uniref:lipopolysaccharide-induced tumor necrosis factor-alpha factor-like n=1 Tax=Condylostylus longicornis TaxID=2530218 RepID=UPI00244E44F4|nr:lipopolysaccharide-induced tumor necrosis factor-alpha factor-like [Condylostylus longicornis]